MNEKKWFGNPDGTVTMAGYTEVITWLRNGNRSSDYVPSHIWA